MRLRLHVRVLVLVGLVVGLLGSMSGSASAAFTYSFAGSLGRSGEPFSELEASSVAVDDGNGDTYVADSGRGEVDVFETASRTQLASLDGLLTPAGSFGGGQVAVAANNATGDVYVLDTTDNVVDVFDRSGGYVCQITGNSTPSASECNGAAGSDTPAHSFSGPLAIALDQATGNVYVLDAEHDVLDIFSAGGAYLRQISLTSLPAFRGVFSEGFAVDDLNGDVYVADIANFGVHTVYVLNSAGAYVGTLSAASTPARSFGSGPLSVAVDDVSGEVYVTDAAHEATDVFAPTNEYLTQIPESSIEGSGTAIDQATNNVYVSDRAFHVVFVFEAVPLPDVTTEAASNVRPTSATLNGTVNPRGLPVTSCVFEYGTETSYGQSVPCVQSPGSGTSPVAVSADLSGLQEGTTYHFRLVASNANGPNQGADVQVTVPAPPTILSTAVENLSADSADLSAAVNSHAAPSTYRIEYGTSAAYGTSVPVPDGAIPAGVTAQTVTQHVSGLRADTTYHWRVVAQNLAGITTGDDHTFIYTTIGGGLPDNRAYEMVTPPHKNAALFNQNPPGLTYPDLSEDGSRMIVRTVGCLAEAGSCSVLRNNGASGEPYVFTRTSSGWVTSALAPPATQLGDNDAYKVSADADTALFGIGMPAGEDDWYARGTDGAFSDIGPISPPSPEAGGSSNNVVATTDFSHVVWQANAGGHGHWPFDPYNHANGSAGNTVYEYVGSGNTEPDLVGVSGGRGSRDLISGCETYLTVGPGAMSADGSTVFFEAAACPSGTGVNAGVPVPANELYARIDESRSVLISGRSPADCTSAACLGSPAGDASFQGASADGSKVFFTSTQQLTDSASEDNTGSASGGGCHETAGVNGCNLYEYDFAAPAGHNLIAVSAGDTNGGGPRVRGVTAVSPDGSRVYFVARGVLTGAGNGVGRTAVDGSENLYVYERDAAFPGGHVAFVATLSDALAGAPGSDSAQWFNVGSGVMNVTPDGRFLVFTSSNALTPDDTSTAGEPQVFRYDALTGALVRISIGDEGFDDNGNRGIPCTNGTCPLEASIVPPLLNHHGERAGVARLDPTMSHDGSFVFFESPVALAPGALDDVQIATLGGRPVYAQNVYEYHEGHVYLLSDGKDIQNYQGFSDVRLLGSDATGANVFFTTSDPLVAQDTDTQQDIYDTRVCTASEPCVASPASSVPCQGEACHGAAGVAPVAPGAGSVAFNGAGNLTAPLVGGAPVKKKVAVKCAKGKRRVHGRCVKAQRKRKGKKASAKRAKANHGGKK